MSGPNRASSALICAVVGAMSAGCQREPGPAPVHVDPPIGGPEGMGYLLISVAGKGAVRSTEQPTVVVPGRGMGAARLEMDRDAIRAVLGEPRQAFAGEEDVWHYDAMKVEFEDDRVAFIESWPERHPEFAGVQLLAVSAEGALQALSTTSAPIEELEPGTMFAATEAGVGLWRQQAEGRFETVAVFGEGYYDAPATTGIVRRIFDWFVNRD